MFRNAGRLTIVPFILFALVGAAHPDASDRKEDARAQRAVAESLRDIAQIYRNETADARRPSQQTEPCRPGDDRRYSDLCAQWKAADAAKASAFWTMMSFYFGLVIGGATVFVAFRAAYWAKEAARHAQKSADAALGAVDQTQAANSISRDNAAIAERAVERAAEANIIAREIGIAQARAYISVAVKSMKYENGQLITTFDVSNSGSSPARGLDLRMTARLYEPKDGGQIAQDGFVEVENLGDMAAGRTIKDVAYKWDLEEERLIFLSSGKYWMQVFLDADYRTVFSDAKGNDKFEYRPVVHGVDNIQIREHGVRILHAT